MTHLAWPRRPSTRYKADFPTPLEQQIVLHQPSFHGGRKAKPRSLTSKESPDAPISHSPCRRGSVPKRLEEHSILAGKRRGGIVSRGAAGLLLASLLLGAPQTAHARPADSPPVNPATSEAAAGIPPAKAKPPAAAKTQEPVFIQAESVERKGDLTIATGNVTVEVQGMRLDCQRLIYDPGKGLITAERECLFTWDDNFAAAQSLVLDVNSNEAVMQKVAGKSEGVVVGDKTFEGSMYFWADTMVYTAKKVTLQDAVLTTCDLEPNQLHYQINSKQVDLYPGDKVVASNTAFTISGNRLYTIPTLIFPLTERKQKRQGYFPSVGYNNTDGGFLRNNFNYSFNQGNYGSISVDFYQRSGIGYGIEHFFDLGERGQGNIYFYNQSGPNAERNRFELRANGSFKIDNSTRLGVSYNANQFQLQGQQSPFNVAGSAYLTRYTEGSALQVGANFSRNGDNNNRTYRFYYDLDLSDQWSILTRADLSNSSTEITQTNRYHYLGSLRNRNDLFEGDLSYERSGGQNTYFLNRQPELSLRSYPFNVGFLPLTASASFGVLEESPSLFRTERYRFDLRVPDQIIETPLGNFHAGAGVRQNLYGSGQEQYVLGTRLGWTQDFADHLLFRFDYNWQNSDGFTPFQHDLAFGYQTLSGGVELYNGDTFRVSTSGAYDLRYDASYDLVTRLDVNPVDGWNLTAAANLDPNTGAWRSVDSGITAQLTPGISLTHWSIYDLLNGRLTYQNFSVNYEDHDWIGSLTYRGVQNEVFLQMSLKAFPLRQTKVGPDPSLPILPVNLSNAFTR